MTRFARAKGSKASNERVPEEGTQWSVMKQQMLQNETEKQQSKKRKEFEQKREENYKAFLEEQKQPFAEPAWAEFSDNEDIQVTKQPINKKDKVKPIVKQTVNGDKLNSKDGKANLVKKKPKNKKSKQISETSDNSELDEEIDKFCNETTNSEMDVEYSKITAELEKKLNGFQTTTKKRQLSVGDTFDDKKITKKNKLDAYSEDRAFDKFAEAIDSISVKKKKLKKRSIQTEDDGRNESTLNVVSAKKNVISAKVAEDAGTNNSTRNLVKKKKGVISATVVEDGGISESTPNVVSRKKKQGVIAAKGDDGDKEVHDSTIAKKNKNKKKTKKSKISNETTDHSDNLAPGEAVDDDDAPAEESIIHTEPVIAVKTKKKKKSKKIKITTEVVKEDNNSIQQSKNETNPKTAPQNPKQNRKDEKIKNRRKPESNQKQFVVINGEKHEIVLYAGFPVKKSDAERLQKLKDDMIKKGIPRNEVFHTMKLERRKAEKALTRDKKKVCFQCRKSGHLLSDCPEIGGKNSSSLIETSASGICFKCGSTEHNSFDCRVVKANDFKFAKCFICGEQGHISRQCPDNPKGLYPQGGGCRICGDVTHLKKDCPQFQQKQEENALTLNTLSSTSNVDDFDDNPPIPIGRSKFSSKQKIVKF